jgi:ankyrin repeat protein
MKLEDGFKSKERKTDLLLAAAYSNRNPDMVERLVKLGADIDARDSISDKTALMDAVSCNYTDVIERLIELGANTRLKTKRNNKTALDLLKKRKDLSYEDKQKLMKLLQ